mgnify:FL=1|tara:strand:- start:621 stop:953 length:333 start_codon:yes stop_codon:yes gene_type:complete
MKSDYYTYITTNPNRTVLYTGVTNNIQERMVEHYLQRGNKKTFAATYYCYGLVWYETFPTAYEAIQAEKYIKGKTRKWKNELIAKTNPTWKFLNEEVLREWPPKKTKASK